MTEPTRITSYNPLLSEVTISRRCRVTDEIYSVTAPGDIFERLGIEQLEVIIPDHSSEERRFIISNLTPAEWTTEFSVGYRPTTPTLGTDN